MLLNAHKFFHITRMSSIRTIPSGPEAEILTRISDTTLQLVALNRRLNSYRPIFRLPPELFLEIFSLIVAEWREWLTSRNTERDGDNKSRLSYRWIPTICNICHYRRKFALNSPSLWDTIIVRDRDSFQVLLKRSRDVPLSLFYLSGAIPRDLFRQIHLCGVVQSHLHRIKSLTIVSLSPSDGIRDALPRGRPPLLQEITICLAQNAVSETVAPDPLNALLSCWVGRDHDKPLTFSLFCVSYSTLQSAVQGNLRQLSLTALPPSITMAMLLSVLKQGTRLEELTLDNATPPMPQEVHELPEPSEVVTLPHLQCLNLIGRRQSLMNFIRHISYPALTSMDIVVEGFENKDSTHALAGRQLGIKLLPNLRHILVRLGGAFYLHGWHTYQPGISMKLLATLPYSPCSVGIFSTGPHESDMKPNLKAFTSMLSSAITEDLQTLHLALDFPIRMQRLWAGADFYEAIAKKAINMTSLHVPSIFHLQEILAPKDRYQEGKSCPTLRNLWIGKLPRQDVPRLCGILEEWARSSDVVLEILSIPEGENYERLSQLVRRLETRE